MFCPPLLGSVLITLPSGTSGWAGPEPRTGPSSREGEGTSAGGCGWDRSQNAARPRRPAVAQRTGGGEGGAAGPARTSGLRKRPVGTSGAWPLQSPLYQGARAKAGSGLVPLFCRKKLGTETRAATLSHVGVLHLQAAHQPGPWSRVTVRPLIPGLPHRALVISHTALPLVDGSFTAPASRKG